MKEHNFFAIIGETVLGIDVDAETLTTDKGTYYFNHEQSCCESVKLFKTIGNKQDLIGKVITLAEEDSGDPAFSKDVEYNSGSYTWSNYFLEV